MIAHAREEDPLECCGLLFGIDEKVQSLFRITNRERSPERYLMEPHEQLTAFKTMRKEGLSHLAIYHSHTHSPAVPSATDIRLAFYPETRYIIISLEKKESPVVRTFRILEEAVSEESFKVEP